VRGFVRLQGRSPATGMASLWISRAGWLAARVGVRSSLCRPGHFEFCEFNCQRGAISDFTFKFFRANWNALAFNFGNFRLRCAQFPPPGAAAEYPTLSSNNSDASPLLLALIVVECEHDASNLTASNHIPEGMIRASFQKSGSSINIARTRATVN
jgi:hypothetical protein